MTTKIKLALRTINRRVRKYLSEEYQLKAAHQVGSKIMSLPLYAQAQRIAIYYPNEGEINLLALWKKAINQGKRCFFPALQSPTDMIFLPADQHTSFKKNKFGIPEPDVHSREALQADQIDIILTPLVAFDLVGTRLGLGAGYYDRALATCSHPTLVGVAYDFQQQYYIPRDIWDKSLNLIITEQHIYWINE